MKLAISSSSETWRNKKWIENLQSILYADLEYGRINVDENDADERDDVELILPGVGVNLDHHISEDEEQDHEAEGDEQTGLGAESEINLRNPLFRATYLHNKLDCNSGTIALIDEEHYLLVSEHRVEQQHGDVGHHRGHSQVGRPHGLALVKDDDVISGRRDIAAW